jgi:hypothetical protein
VGQKKGYDMNLVQRMQFPLKNLYENIKIRYSYEGLYDDGQSIIDSVRRPVGEIQSLCRQIIARPDESVLVREVVREFDILQGAISNAYARGGTFGRTLANKQIGGYVCKYAAAAQAVALDAATDKSARRDFADTVLKNINTVETLLSLIIKKENERLDALEEFYRRQMQMNAQNLFSHTNNFVL